MSATPALSPARRNSGATLFLPDLCAPGAVLAMIISVELFVIVIMLGAFGIRGFSWEFLAVTSFLALWVVLTSAALLCSIRARLQKLPLAVGVSISMLVILSVTLLFSLPADWVAQGMPERGMLATLDWLNVLRNLLIAAIVGGMLLRYVQVQSALQQREHAELEQRYRALQARIRPHFLFNSMNMLAGLVRSDPGLAETAIEDMCELFRAALQDHLQPVTFAEERELCESYLRIEQLRLGDRLQVDWTGTDLPGWVPIPLLTVQPLLENAVYHGVQTRTRGGTVHIMATMRDAQVHIEVRNPQPDRGVVQPGNQMALENIRQRLVTAFGANASLRVESGADEFRVWLTYTPPAPGPRE